MNGCCFFISDAHLRPIDAPGEREKQQRLLSFFRHLRAEREKDRADHLFIVGDFFDFWFDYRSVVPRRAGQLLGTLADLVEAGISVTLFGGNHDWWLGDSLTEEYGITVRHEPLWLKTQGRTLYIAHGDGVSVPSRSYNVLRYLLHHPLAIMAFRVIHPDWGAALARLVADTSRGRTCDEDPEEQRLPIYERICDEVFAAGADIAVFGHVHTARIKTTHRGTLVVLGDWINLHTYGELRDGIFHLRTWEPPNERR